MTQAEVMRSKVIAGIISATGGSHLVIKNWASGAYTCDQKHKVGSQIITLFARERVF
jgi:hypothetical protein